MIPGEAAAAALVNAQSDRGGEGVGDQPGPGINRADDAAPPAALPSETLDACGLEDLTLAATEMRRIRANQQPNERR